MQKRALAREVKLVELEKKLNRPKREYTEEERKAIRARLLAGQEATRKRQEAVSKATEKVTNNPEEARTIEA